MTYRVWVEDTWREVSVPEMGGEPLVVPNIAAVVLNRERTALLLQRRDKAGEPVRGKLEIPGGRWAAGEPPDVALAREVAEETGLELVAPIAEVTTLATGPNRYCAIARPVAVINGIAGAYPSLHVLFECTADGEPRPQPGETADPGWWPLDAVRAALRQSPEDFVDQTRAMLTAYFG